ncbi:phosphatase PAP2 family protein [Secundilactobacillus odoratitofui]
MIGFDRIYLFVHYPTDVLGGSCLALFWLACVKLGAYYFNSSKVQRSTE